jgi:hypothetical protein
MSNPTQPPPPSAADFATRDPANASFWDERFARGVTPWEFGGVPEGSARSRSAARRAVLIPGCGSAGRPAGSRRPASPVRDRFRRAGGRRREGDARCACGRRRAGGFFAYQPPFVVQWVYERAFLCALPPSLRAGYAARMAELLPAGGLLAGYFFVMKKPKGPPFGIERAELDALLAPSFELIEDLPVTDSLAVFDGHERWLTWRRR